MSSFTKIDGRKIRIAVVGCGRISKVHFKSIFKHSSDLELVAICDDDQQALSESQKKFGVPAYLEISKMMENEEIDLVVLCTPSGVHASQAILSSRYGLHVMTEKPMATSWEDGIRMVNACDEAGVRLFVVKQNRWNKTLRLLKQAVTDRRFGNFHMVHLNVFWTRPQSYYDQGNGWRGTWKYDGRHYFRGTLWNLCSPDFRQI